MVVLASGVTPWYSVKVLLLRRSRRSMKPRPFIYPAHQSKPTKLLKAIMPFQYLLAALLAQSGLQVVNEATNDTSIIGLYG